ncbi:MAG: hypothetical protein ACI841_004110 [Planctomycetota bacterium]|jgi:hypothetical protein
MKLARTNQTVIALGAGTVALAAWLVSMQGTVTATHIDCVQSVRDASSPMDCLPASSAPQLGHLYPLSTDLNVDAEGQVGMGTATPSAGLQVVSQVIGADGLRSAGAPDPTGVGGDGVIATGGSGADSEAGGAGLIATGGPAGMFGPSGAGGSGGPGIIATGGTGTIPGPGLVAIGAFSPPLSGSGIVSFGANSDTVPGIGIEANGGGGNFGTDGSEGVYGRGGNADVWNGMFPTVGGDGLVGMPGMGEVAGLAVLGLGDIVATGMKCFASPHPTDPAREIRFVCLEGNESGTYFRGSAQAIDGRAVIEVPEEFRLVTGREGMTVQLTAVGGRADLWIEERGLDRIVVRSDADVEFDYFVNGVRIGFEQHQSIIENRSFVPETAGEAFGAQYPAGLRQILVDNGTLKPNFEPNEQTASRMGWPLKRAEDRPFWETGTTLVH